MPNKDKTTPQPLAADISRQATGLFKGVDYQVWLTVLAWIDLAEEEMLVIEGAEDFDVVTTTAGLSVQVKALADPISFRSESVVSAIQHFWQHKQANHPRAVRFRFVTTAEAAVETTSPFGKGVAGLKLWNVRGHSQYDYRRDDSSVPAQRHFGAKAVGCVVASEDSTVDPVSRDSIRRRRAAVPYRAYGVGSPRRWR